MNHYEVLGVPRNASQAEVKKAFRERAWRAHPDRGGSPETMTALNKAYDVLMDPELREQYDRTGDDRVLATLDYMARDAVMNAVMQLIDTEHDQDIVAAMVAGFTARQDEIGRDLSTIPGRIARMQRRAQRVRAKGQANLVQMIVAQRVAQLDKVRQDLEGSLPIIARALEMVAEHEWVAEQAAGAGVEWSIA